MKIRMFFASIFIFGSFIFGIEETKAVGGTFYHSAYTHKVSIPKSEYFPGETIRASAESTGGISSTSYHATLYATVNGYKKAFYTCTTGGTLYYSYDFTAQSVPGSYTVLFRSEKVFNTSDYKLYNIPYTVVALPINGSCGSANGGSYSSPPTTNLCASGSPSAVTTNTDTYAWSCYGSDGGTNASCSAIRIGQSCTRPCGGTTASGTWGEACYASSSVACGSVCASSSGFCSDGVWTTPYASGYAQSSCSVATDCPSLTLAADPTSITSGSSSTLTWTTSNASSCWASGGWTGWKTNTGGTESVYPTANTTYNLECWNSAGASSGIKTASVSIINQAPRGTFEEVSCSGDSIIASGWAFDPDNSSDSISVNIYTDGPAIGNPSQKGSDKGNCLANIYRGDVNSSNGITGNHGFSCPISGISDGVSHSVYIYALDYSSGAKTVLSENPRSITCSPFSWQVKADGGCTETCGTGIQKYTYFCQNANDGSQVEDSKCTDSKPVDFSADCDLPACPASSNNVWREVAP